MKWIYLTTAPDQTTAEMWRELLIQNGVAAMIRPGDVASFLGTSLLPCRLLVLEEQKEEAEGILTETLGAER